MELRIRLNVIISIPVNDVYVEGANGVRSFDHFHNHFQVIAVDRPGIEDLSFKSITREEGPVPFQELGIKQEVWDCDGFKNLGFIKDFWEVLKDKLIHFLADFYCNGKLTKGINNSFIALIPKVESPQRLSYF
ncbi:unnamed protein product [Lathyrus oleraceus]